MKKSNLTSLKLNKKSISSLNQELLKGGLNTVGCYTKQLCPLDPIDTATTFQPIPNPDDDGPVTLSDFDLC